MSSQADFDSNPYASLNFEERSGLRPRLRIELSVMMFLQYFVWGVWFVTLGTYLDQTLKFSGREIGLAYQTSAIATILSPFFVGMVADRFFPTQRLLGVLHLLGAGLIYYASTLTEFTPLRLVLLGYFLCYMPTISLTNSLSFHHIGDADRYFPGIRVLGTIGWIAAGWTASYAGTWLNALGWKFSEGGLEKLNTPMQIAAAVSVVLGLYCFLLPHTPPKGTGPVSPWTLLGLDALRLMKRWPFAVFVVGSFLICIPLQFYYTWMNPFLTDLGLSKSAALQTYGQMSEIVFMLLMPLFFVRLGVKKMLLLGMAAWAIRYVLFAYGNAGPMYWMLVVGIVLHGICYDFFFLTGNIYVDRNATPDIRAAAQGFLALVTWGVSGLIGTWLSGLIAERATVDGVRDWHYFWLWPAVAAGAVLVVFALTFFDPKYDRSAAA